MPIENIIFLVLELPYYGIWDTKEFGRKLLFNMQQF
jgi:hypothetical protein